MGKLFRISPEFWFDHHESTYSFVFTMNATTDQNSRLSFNFGGATGTVFLDNVVIEKTETLLQQWLVENIDSNEDFLFTWKYICEIWCTEKQTSAVTGL